MDGKKLEIFMWPEHLWKTLLDMCPLAKPSKNRHFNLLL